MIDKIYVKKKGSKQIDYTVRFIRFYNVFISRDAAKDLVRKDMHISKEKMKNEYVTVYGLCKKVGRGKNAHYELFIPIAKRLEKGKLKRKSSIFNDGQICICAEDTKNVTANAIFIIPKNKKRHFEKILPNIEFR